MPWQISAGFDASRPCGPRCLCPALCHRRLGGLRLLGRQESKVAFGDTAAIRARDLAALDESNRALQTQVWSLQDAKAAAEAAAQAEAALASARSNLEGQILQLTGDTAALRARELTALDASLRPLQERIYALQDEAATAQAAAQAEAEAVAKRATIAQQGASLMTQVAPGAVNTLAVSDTDAEAVRVAMKVGGTTLVVGQFVTIAQTSMPGNWMAGQTKPHPARDAGSARQAGWRREAMTKLLSPVLAEYRPDRVAFRCPGCEGVHVIPVAPEQSGDSWGYNGNPDAPTFTPSVLVRTGRAVDPAFVPEPGDPPEICHSFVTDGRIQFLGDCTHALAGQTVPLPEFRP